VAADPDFEVGEWGTPGDYRAPFIPTQPGAYTFHVTGSVDGTDIDVSVRSGPKTFSDVVDPAEAMFPAVDAPSTADLATKVTVQAARTDAAIRRPSDPPTPPAPWRSAPWWSRSQLSGSRSRLEPGDGRIGPRRDSVRRARLRDR
jgi:hypothetical protein